MDRILLLTTLDHRYLPQLQVMLTSLRVNNPGETVSLYLLHSGIPAEALSGVRQQCDAYGYSFYPICVDEHLFKNAPVSRQYPKEMYYRLLAPQLLPPEAKGIVFNPLGVNMPLTITKTQRPAANGTE